MTPRLNRRGGPEIVAVAAALNFLAGRIRDLVSGERERVADLSHRLRAPLTSLRLEAEASGHDDLLAGVDRLERAVTDVIADARRPLHPPGRRGACDLGVVVGERVEFWGALADEHASVALILLILA